MSDGTSHSTFLIHKHIYDPVLLNQQDEDFPHDETSCTNSPSLHDRIHMGMMSFIKV